MTLRLGPWIRARRVERGVDVGDAATRLGLTVEAMTDVEAGARLMPHPALVDYAALAQLLLDEPTPNAVVVLRAEMYALYDEDRRRWDKRDASRPRPTDDR
jgi:transcriptional regulator with XRE-family HTH domain